MSIWVGVWTLDARFYYNFDCIFHFTIMFVFVLYNTNIIDCYKYFVLQWEDPCDQGSNPLQSA
jgi:hypothetical protein